MAPSFETAVMGRRAGREDSALQEAGTGATRRPARPAQRRPTPFADSSPPAAHETGSRCYTARTALARHKTAFAAPARRPATSTSATQAALSAPPTQRRQAPPSTATTYAARTVCPPAKTLSKAPSPARAPSFGTTRRSSKTGDSASAPATRGRPSPATAPQAPRRPPASCPAARPSATPAAAFSATKRLRTGAEHAASGRPAAYAGRYAAQARHGRPTAPRPTAKATAGRAGTSTGHTKSTHKAHKLPADFLSKRQYRPANRLPLAINAKTGCRLRLSGRLLRPPRKVCRSLPHARSPRQRLPQPVVPLVKKPPEGRLRP